MSLRVALVSGNYNYVRDGANRALNRLVGFLEDEAGAAVRVYSPVTSTPAFAPTGTLIPVPSWPLPGRSEYRIALRLSARVKRDIEAFGPDLFHLSAPDVLGYRALAFAEALGVPAVASLHTRFETYFDYYGLGWARALAERYLRGFYERCAYVLVPTAAIRDEMVPVLGKERVRVWGRGVDAELFNPERRSESWRRSLGFGADEIVVAFFGRVVVEKGTDLFAQVVRDLEERGVPVRVLVIGDGPARAAMTKALPQAHFTGTLSGDALAEALACADILVNPSVTEAFGNVVLEAMASGLASVCADVASARNLVEPGITGVLCPALDAAAYAEAVEALVHDRTKLAAMKRAAAAASARYSWNGVCNEVPEVYERAVAGARMRSLSKAVQRNPMTGERPT